MFSPDCGCSPKSHNHQSSEKEALTRLALQVAHIPSVNICSAWAEHLFCLFCLWRAQTATYLHTDGCACPAVTFQVFSSHSALGFALLGYFFPFRIDSDATQRIKPCLLTASGSHRSHSTPASVTFLWILINEVCNKLTIEQQQQHMLM